MLAEFIDNSNQQPILDAIIVHGSGVVLTHLGYRPGHDGIWRTIAAVQAYEESITHFLVFSGGYTLGAHHPSEAQVMNNYLSIQADEWHGKFPHILSQACILEEMSKTTAANIRVTRKLIQESGWNSVGYLSSRYHLPYIVELARNYGLTPKPLATEDLLLRRDPSYQADIEEYYNSPQMRRIRITQFILRVLLKVDPKAQIPELIAFRTRN